MTMTETKAKHTPGPWELHYLLSDGAFSVIPANSDFVICQRAAHTRRAEECQANARLIAAAPEMLEALEMLSAWAPHTVNPDLSENPDCEHCKIQAVIRKARGE